MKFCPTCGAELKPEAKFCAACGTQMAADQAPPQPAPPPPYQQQEPVYQQAREAQSAFTDAISGNTNLVQRVINILTKPKEEWPLINAEQPNTFKLIFGYALILSLIPAVASFIATGVIGTSVMGYTYRSVSGGIMQALVQLFTAVIGVYLLAFVIDLLAPSFDSQKNMGKSLQLSVYSSTATWVAGILLIVPVLKWFSFLAGLYAIYLLAVGMPVLKGTPKDKVVGYVALSIVAMILIYVVIAAILAGIFGLLFFGSMSGFNF